MGASSIISSSNPTLMGAHALAVDRLSTRGPKLALKDVSSNEQRYAQMEWDVKKQCDEASKDHGLRYSLVFGADGLFSLCLTTSNRIVSWSENIEYDRQNPKFSTSYGLDATGCLMQPPPGTVGKEVGA